MWINYSLDSAFLLQHDLLQRSLCRHDLDKARKPTSQVAEVKTFTYLFLNNICLDHVHVGLAEIPHTHSDRTKYSRKKSMYTQDIYILKQSH